MSGVTNELDILETIQELRSVTCKRNTALTIIEPRDINKCLSKIEKRVSMIKHSNKRGQLISVLRELKSYISNLTYKNGIFCTGLRTDNTYYTKFIPLTSEILDEVKDTYYNYDDIFDTFEISRLLLSITEMDDKDIGRLRKKLESTEDSYNYKSQYFIDDEINNNLSYLDTIVWIVKRDTYSDIPIDFLRYHLGKKKKIKLLDLNKKRDILTRENRDSDGKVASSIINEVKAIGVLLK